MVPKTQKTWWPEGWVPEGGAQKSGGRKFTVFFLWSTQIVINKEGSFGWSRGGPGEGGSERGGGGGSPEPKQIGLKLSWPKLVWLNRGPIWPEAVWPEAVWPEAVTAGVLVWVWGVGSGVWMCVAGVCGLLCVVFVWCPVWYVFSIQKIHPPTLF